MRKGKRKLTRFGWVIIVLLLFLGVGSVYLMSRNQAPSSVAKVKMEQKKAGKYKKETKKIDQSWFVKHYPDFKQENMKTFVDETMESFDEKIASLKPEDGFLAMSDYRSFKKDKMYSSVEMLLLVDGVEVDRKQITVANQEDHQVGLGQLMNERGLKLMTFDSMADGFTQLDLAKEYDRLSKSSQYYLDSENLTIGNEAFALSEIGHYFKESQNEALSESDIPYVYVPRLIDKTNKKLVAFTFDDGPHASVTEKVASYFESIDSKVTFFQLGQNIERYPEMLPRLAAAGHEMAYHSYSHPNLVKVSPDELKHQVNDSSLMINDILKGKGQILLRPPYGSVNDEIMSKFSNPVINWSVDSNDWGSRNSQAVCNEIMRTTEPGDIILLHDIYETSYEGAVCAAKQLKEQGYEFVTVSELMSAYDVSINSQMKYFSASNYR